MITYVWAVTLTVSDLDRAVEFYGETLGLAKKYRFGDYAGFDCGGVEIGLRTWGGLGGPRQGEPCLDLAVDSLDETYEALSANGVTFTKDRQAYQTRVLWPEAGRIEMPTEPGLGPGIDWTRIERL